MKLLYTLLVTTTFILNKSSKTNKSKSKNIPFNVSLPWGVSIADYLGIHENELNENIEKDQSLHSTVSSTCELIRD